MKIDVHNHAIPPAVIELMGSDPVYETRVDGDRVSGGNHISFTIFPSFRDPDAKVRELDDKRLDGAIISAAPPIFFYNVPASAGEAICRAANQGFREFVASQPDRLRWMAHVPMGAPQRAAEMLTEAVADGACGVEIGTSIAGKRLDEPEFEAFWAAAEKAEVPVMLHPSYNETNRALDKFYLQNVIGNLLETTIAIERLICAGVLDRHPGLRIFLVHAGGYYPFQAGRLRHAKTVRPELKEAPADPWAYRGRVFVDTITHDVDALTYLVSRMGADNVVIGTDLPFDMATPEPVTELEKAVDSRTARHIAEENPARLYGFGG